MTVTRGLSASSHWLIWSASQQVWFGQCAVQTYTLIIHSTKTMTAQFHEWDKILRMDPWRFNIYRATYREPSPTIKLVRLSWFDINFLFASNYVSAHLKDYSNYSIFDYSTTCMAHYLDRWFDLVVRFWYENYSQDRWSVIQGIIGYCTISKAAYKVRTYIISNLNKRCPRMNDLNFMPPSGLWDIKWLSDLSYKVLHKSKLPRGGNLASMEWASGICYAW